MRKSRNGDREGCGGIRFVVDAEVLHEFEASSAVERLRQCGEELVPPLFARQESDQEVDGVFFAKLGGFELAEHLCGPVQKCVHDEHLVPSSGHAVCVVHDASFAIDFLTGRFEDPPLRIHSVVLAVVGNVDEFLLEGESESRDQCVLILLRHGFSVSGRAEAGQVRIVAFARSKMVWPHLAPAKRNRELGTLLCYMRSPRTFL